MSMRFRTTVMTTTTTTTTATTTMTTMSLAPVTGAGQESRAMEQRNREKGYAKRSYEGALTAV